MLLNLQNVALIFPHDYIQVTHSWQEYHRSDIVHFSVLPVMRNAVNVSHHG